MTLNPAAAPNRAHTHASWQHIPENVVVLCGSTRFKSTFESIDGQLTLQGKVVIKPACLWHADGQVPSAAQRELLDRVYDQKILLSEAVLVLNVGGYLGDSTRREIEYAECHGRKVYYLEEK